MSLPPDPTSGEPTATVEVQRVEVTPGEPATVGVRVTNRSAASGRFALRVVGYDPEWTTVPSTVGPLGPGAAAMVGLELRVPVGHPASQLVGTVEVRALDERSGEPTGPAAHGDLVVTVGDASAIAGSIVPPEVRGRHKARFAVVLHNRSKSPMRVDLSPVTPDEDVEVRLDSSSSVLTPGTEVRVPGEVRSRRPVLGEDTRRPFGVKVQGRTTPLLLEGSLVQRPLRAAWVMKAAAVLVVLALWTAVAVVGINALNTHLHKAATARALANEPISVPNGPSGGSGTNTQSTTTTTHPVHKAPAAKVAGQAHKAAGGSSSGGSSSGGSSSGGSTSGGSSGTSSSSGGSSASPQTSSGSSGSGSATTTVSGRVQAADPSGATVTIAPASLVDQPLTGGGAQTVADTSGPLGKIPASLAADVFDAPSSALTDPTLTTTTGPDGFWSFSGVPTPGYYEVTITKPGYGTVKKVVDLTGGQPSPITFTLSPGSGSIAGTVDGPSGPLGDVAVSITDGTVSLSTKTPTTGATGTWQVSGLTTPDSYLVSATAPGYGTQTTLVNLGAGGTASGVDLTLVPGVAAITGTVTSSSDPNGVGGVTVTASNGTTSLTATTTTVNPVGSFTLPDLAMGTYALTVSGGGWITETQSVTLSGNIVVNPNLTASTAEVTGVVSKSGGGGLSDAGVILSNNTTTLKTLTESAAPVGGFDFTDVPPGQYVLTAEDFGYTTESAEVTLGPGAMQSVNLSLPFVGSAVPATASIDGSVGDLFSAQPIAGATVTLDGGPTTTTTDANGDYSFSGVLPGLHQITAVATNHSPATVSIAVPLGGVAFAPRDLLPTLDELYGTVSSNAGGFVADPVVTLTNPVTGASVGTVKQGLPNAGQGAYEIDDIPQGNYDLVVTGPGNVYLPSGNLPVTMGLDAAPQQLNTSLNLEAFSVYTLEAQSQGVPTSDDGVTVTLTDLTNPSAQPITGTSAGTPALAQLPITPGQQYSASFSGTDGATTAPVVFVGQLNAQPTTVFLALPLASPTVMVQFPYNLPTGTITCTLGPAGGNPTCPGLASPPTVTLTGTFGYTASSPGEPGTPIIRTVTAVPNASGYPWAFSFAGETAGLLPSQVTFDVHDPTGAFQDASAVVNPTGPGFAAVTVQLKPIAGAVTGTVSPSSGVTVTLAPPVATVTVNASGDVVWNDPAAGQVGLAEPGVYNVTFGASGFDDDTVSATVPLQGTTCGGSCGTVVNATLVRHFTIDVTPVFTVIPGLSGPVVTLTDSKGQVGQPTPLTGGTAAFSNLSVADAPYSYTVATPGYAEYSSGTISIASAGSGTVPETPTLVEEGYVTGTVSGLINTTSNALPGATLTTVDNGGACGSVPTVTTDSSGNFIIVGDPTTANGGLCVGESYTVTAAEPTGGYNTQSATFTIGAAGDTTQNFTLTANKITVHLDVTDSSSNPVTNATIVAVSSVGTSPVTATNDGGGDYHVVIDPTLYTFNVSASGFAPLNVGPIPYTPGVNPQTVQIQLSPDMNTITGTATTPGSSSGVPGVTVDLFQAGQSSVYASATTGANGTYTITKQGDNDGGGGTGFIPDGSYTLSASLNGYTFVPPNPASFSTTYPTTVENVQLTVDPVPLTVQVSSTTGENLDGATLKLQPVTPPHGTNLTCGSNTLVGLGQGSTQTTTVSGGDAFYAQVQPDYYQVTIDLSSLSPSHPAQSATDLVVCPFAGTNPSPPTFVVQEGSVSGTITVPGGTASAAVVDIYTGTSASGTPQVAPVTCGPTCGTGTYLAYVALGNQYTVTVNDDAFQQAEQTTAQLTAGSPTATFSPTLVPDTHEVQITVTSGTATPIPLDNPSVTLDLGANVYTSSSVSGDVATFMNIPPGTYTTPFTDEGVSGNGSVTVPLADNSIDPVTQTVTASAGQLTGTLTLNPAPASNTTVTLTFCLGSAGCGSPTFSEPVTVGTSGSAPYAAYLPPGTYVVTGSAAGYTTTSTGSESVSDGTVTSGGDLTLP